jgi:hypothetical protein
VAAAVVAMQAAGTTAAPRRPGGAARHRAAARRHPAAHRRPGAARVPVTGQSATASPLSGQRQLLGRESSRQLPHRSLESARR